jgi:CubicO group peptidase (beta-lactamase class C family)
LLPATTARSVTWKEEHLHAEALRLEDEGLTPRTWRIKNAMNMAMALDNEETFESLMDPSSWISSFFTAAFGGTDDPREWRKLLREAQPLPNEKPGDRFRYSTPNTQVLVLAVKNKTQMSWEQY